MISYNLGLATNMLKWTPDDKFLRDFSWSFYLLSDLLPEIC